MTHSDRRNFMCAAAALAVGAVFDKASSAQPPRSSFGPKSTAEEVTAGIDLAGKTALVTGCNSGLGYETMRVLALRGAHVLGTARTAEKGKEACAKVKGLATPLVMELMEFDTIVDCANHVRRIGVPIDMLVCNAGVVVPELQQVMGLEKHFVVNHLGHFVLVNHLLAQVKAARQGRIVVVSSSAHRSATNGIEFDNLSGERDYDRRRMYGQSKLANALFSRELARRLGRTRATSNSLCPGGVKTEIFRDLPQSSSMLTKSVEEGAATSCYVATAPALATVTGAFFRDCNAARDGGFMEDDAMARRLWQVSTELARKYLA